MPKVEFVTDGVTIEVEMGVQLASIVDDEGLSVPFGCRDAQCGTCMITVHEGIENLQPASDDERETLSMNDADENQRLCCQAIVKGDLKIEAI